MSIPCPTCGAVGNQTCVRGRKPRQVALVGSFGLTPGTSDIGAVWQQQIPFPEGHDSRRTANQEKKGLG